MFLFIRLLLGHLIGDFPLQFNKIYEFKHRGIKGGIPHATLVILSLLILSWPYLNILEMWRFILLVGIIHLFQDSVKISYGNKLRHSLWLYLLDQIFHVAIIASIFITKLRYLEPPQNNGSILVAIYNNNVVIIYLSALIIATYNGYYLIRTFRTTFLGNPGIYNEFEKWYGVLERAVIVTPFLMKGLFWGLIPIVFLLRPATYFFEKKKLNLNTQFASPLEMVLSWAVAVVTGACLFIILQKPA